MMTQVLRSIESPYGCNLVVSLRDVYILQTSAALLPIESIVTLTFNERYQHEEEKTESHSNQRKLTCINNEKYKVLEDTMACSICMFILLQRVAHNVHHLVHTLVFRAATNNYFQYQLICQLFSLLTA